MTGELQLHPLVSDNVSTQSAAMPVCESSTLYALAQEKADTVCTAACDCLCSLTDRICFNSVKALQHVMHANICSRRSHSLASMQRRARTASRLRFGSSGHSLHQGLCANQRSNITLVTEVRKRTRFYPVQ